MSHLSLLASLPVPLRLPSSAWSLEGEHLPARHCPVTRVSPLRSLNTPHGHQALSWCTTTRIQTASWRCSSELPPQFSGGWPCPGQLSLCARRPRLRSSHVLIALRSMLCTTPLHACYIRCPMHKTARLSEAFRSAGGGGPQSRQSRKPRLRRSVGCFRAAAAPGMRSEGAHLDPCAAQRGVSAAVLPANNPARPVARLGADDLAAALPAAAWLQGAQRRPACRHLLPLHWRSAPLLSHRVCQHHQSHLRLGLAWAASPPDSPDQRHFQQTAAYSDPPAARSSRHAGRLARWGGCAVRVPAQTASAGWRGQLSRSATARCSPVHMH